MTARIVIAVVVVLVIGAGWLAIAVFLAARTLDNMVDLTGGDIFPDNSDHVRGRQ